MAPGPLLLDNHSWKQLLKERRHSSGGGSVPLRWHRLIDEISRELTGEPIEPWTLRHAFSRHAQLIAWLPSLSAVFMAFRKRGHLIYLCWGVPAYKGLKRMAFRLMLTRAAHLLVNEDVTRTQIKAAIGRSARIVPYFVDTDYFSYHPVGGRKGFLFCAGSNDRDPEVLLGLAEVGYEVVWLVNDPRLLATYSNRHSRLQVRSRVPYEILRKLYQTCAAVVSPLARDLHAAGQSTGLEALACGAPLLISPCRAATLFEAMPSVCVVESSEPAVWSRAVQDLSDRVAKEPRLTEIVALTVGKRFTYEAVKEILAGCLTCSQLRDGVQHYKVQKT